MPQSYSSTTNLMKHQTALEKMLLHVNKVASTIYEAPISPDEPRTLRKVTKVSSPNNVYSKYYFSVIPGIRSSARPM